MSHGKLRACELKNHTMRSDLKAVFKTSGTELDRMTQAATALTNAITEELLVTVKVW